MRVNGRSRAAVGTLWAGADSDELTLAGTAPESANGCILLCAGAR